MLTEKSTADIIDEAVFLSEFDMAPASGDDMEIIDQILIEYNIF